ncbi:MAG TPA: ABC transporter substrate binding protein [Rhodocyclaceae bacterium]|nr:ABC transporter substrate binding protein [Rhodocyclaceae bacterium]
MILLPANVRAGQEVLSIRLLVSEAVPFAQQTATQLEAQLRRESPLIAIEESGPVTTNTRRLIVAVGGPALGQALRESSHTPILTVATPGALLDKLPRQDGVALHVIQMEMPAGRLFNLIRLVFPQHDTVGVLFGPSSRARATQMESAAAERGIRLVAERVDQEVAVGPATERLVQHAPVLLALPDSVVHNATTVPPLLLIAYRAGVPLLGYSESYLRAGAMVALYATAGQVAQQAFDVIKAYHQGHPLPGLQVPRYYSVGVNATVARSLGLSPPPAEVLENRLRQMRE